MKFVDEYRDPRLVEQLFSTIRRISTRPVAIMEVCGGQTHTILKSGLEQLLPDTVRLIHGPGCPVCVTPIELIDHAVFIAHHPKVMLTSYGDMLRVPGTSSSLLQARSLGALVRMVYSPLDAVELASQHPDRDVVFFAVGFETTAPANAMAVLAAQARGLKNFSILSSHVLVPPAIDALMIQPDNLVDAFLAAGHVCTVMGTAEYEPLAERHRIPIVVSGFEPLDLLRGIARAVAMLEAGEFGVRNEYPRAVVREGNRAAKTALERVFVVCDRVWRGIGTIPASGLSLRPEYAEFDATLRFPAPPVSIVLEDRCHAGEVLRGVLRPNACPAFGIDCTPEHPLGAPMVSSEGACAAYHRYARHRVG